MGVRVHQQLLLQFDAHSDLQKANACWVLFGSGPSQTRRLYVLEELSHILVTSYRLVEGKERGQGREIWGTFNIVAVGIDVR